MPQVAFELDLTTGRVRDVRATATAGALRDTFTWSVTCADNQVEVYALEQGGLHVVGRCTIDAAGVVRDRVGGDDDEPNDYQWGRVVDGLGLALRRTVTIEGERRTDARLRRGSSRPRPVPPRSAPQPTAPPPPSPRRGGPARVPSPAVIGGAVAGGAALIAVAVVVSATRDRSTRRPASPPPAPAPVAIAPTPPLDPTTADDADAALTDAPMTVEETVVAAPSLAAAIAVVRDRPDAGTDDSAWLLARYASRRAAWADLHVADAETTLPLILKDGERERGLRLCATGRLLDIVRTELDQRPVYTGALVTADGDTVRFIAVGSTGTLVKRSTGTLCGVAAGRVGDAALVVGMFDLPENAQPIVER